MWRQATRIRPRRDVERPRAPIADLLLRVRQPIDDDRERIRVVPDLGGYVAGGADGAARRVGEAEVERVHGRR